MAMIPIRRRDRFGLFAFQGGPESRLFSFAEDRVDWADSHLLSSNSQSVILVCRITLAK